MPIRRLNYTARQRIARSDVDLVIRGQDTNDPYFDAALRLSEYGFPPDARVVVEAYRQTILMRFDFGSVSVPKVPTDRRLTDFLSVENILFRLKVTAASVRPGVLLGEAEQLQPREPNMEPERRLALLPVVPMDLEQEVWRIDFEGTTTLLVNRNLRDWKQTAASDEFRGLVYPAALRQILERILLIEKYFSTDDPVDWRSRWLQFSARIPGSGGPPPNGASEDQIFDWIDGAVAAFSRRFNLYTLYEAETAQ
jgi:hypothetical protein